MFAYLSSQCGHGPVYTEVPSLAEPKNSTLRSDKLQPEAMPCTLEPRRISETSKEQALRCPLVGSSCTEGNSPGFIEHTLRLVEPKAGRL